MKVTSLRSVGADSFMPRSLRSNSLRSNPHLLFLPSASVQPPGVRAHGRRWLDRTNKHVAEARRAARPSELSGGGGSTEAAQPRIEEGRTNEALIYVRVHVAIASPHPDFPRHRTLLHPSSASRFPVRSWTARSAPSLSFICACLKVGVFVRAARRKSVKRS